MAKKYAQRRENINKALRQTTITITLSVCAMAMAILLIAFNWLQEQKVSIVGILIVVGMIVNLVQTFRRRRQLQEGLAVMPKAKMKN